jgi:hypothetical protein
VFVEGGISLDEAALLNGVETGDELLKILSETPTRKQVEDRIKRDPIREQVERNKIQAKNEATRLQAIDESFSKVTNLHLKEMNEMKSRSWNTVKRGIIKLAGKVPTLMELNTKAKDTVKGMKIRDLNPIQFKQGEATSQRLAIKQFVDGKIEQAFGNKGKAALNSELMKETIKARDKVAKNVKFWKKMQDPSNIQELKDAGYHNALKDYMAAYKLEGAIPNEKEQNAFKNFIKRQVELGNYTPHVPDRLNNTQTSFKDLTVEQYDTITEMGQYLLTQAKNKNKMLADQKLRKEFETQEYVAEQIDKLTKEHIDYDPTRPKREEKTTKDGEFIENVKNAAKSLMSAVNNVKNIVFELDNHEHNGFFYRTFVDPLVRAQTAKREENLSLRDHLKAVITEHYGDMKAYDAMVNERLEIPEFDNFDTLNNGHVRKIDLMRLMAFLGDPDGRSRIENYKGKDASGSSISMDLDTVMKVLDREINEKEAGFVQNFFVNPYKRFEKASADLHKRTTGVEPEMVKGIPIVHRGKVYEGGYQPLEYQRLPDEIRAQKELASMEEQGVLDEGEFFARMRAAEMTKKDRLKDRSGSLRPLELHFENHFRAMEEIIHDLHFREPGIDMMKIMKQPHNVQNIKSVIGSKKFVLMLDSMKDVVSKTSDKDQPIFRDQSAIVNGMLGFGKQLHAIKAISYNVASAAIQWDSLMYMPLRAGPKTFAYMGKTVAKLIANPMQYMKAVEVAKEILPDIKYEQDAIDDSLVKSSEEFIPYDNKFFKNYKGLGKGLTRLSQMRKAAIDHSFILLREADKFNKVIATLSLSDQFLNGDIEGYSKDVLDKMSDTEKKETMQKVVKQIVDLSLTASSRLDKTALEKNKVAQLFVNYWTDRRSRLNSMSSQINKARKSVKEGNHSQAVTQLMFLGVVSGVSVALQNQIRGKDEEEGKKIRNLKDAGMFALEGMYDFAMNPVSQMAQSVPGIDAMLYAYDSTINYGRGKQVRPVSLPHIAVLTDIVAGAVSMRKAAKKGRVAKSDRKALITLGGFAIGGAPTNTLNKVIDMVGSSSIKRNVKEGMNDLLRFNKTVDAFKEEYKDEPDAKDFIQDLEDYQKTLPKFENDGQTVVPEGTKESIKKAVSGGDWTKYNEDTGAIGVYQFTEERWKELMLAHPDLGLTENGRLAKDPSQQEKAMDRESQDTLKSLIAYEIPVSKENIFGVHKFGFDNFSSIFEAKDDKKLSEVIGDEVSKPEFKGFTTAGDVKKYLSRSLKD